MDMYHKGYRVEDMAKELGVSLAKAYKVLSEQGIPTSRDRVRAIHNQRYMKYIELYNSGYSVKDIAKEIGVSIHTLKDYFTKAKSENKITMRRKYN